jgi:hypothetical protein
MPKLRKKLATPHVFINCPFDDQYKAQFNAIVFTIYDCGFYPRCALESSDSGELRFQKICRLIRDPVLNAAKFRLPGFKRFLESVEFLRFY